MIGLIIEITDLTSLNFPGICLPITFVKLPGHAARTGQACRGFPGRKCHFNCAPYPAYPALAGGALAGQVAIGGFNVEKAQMPFSLR
jgi:hypothetical protein